MLKKYNSQEAINKKAMKKLKLDLKDTEDRITENRQIYGTFTQ